MTAIRVSNVSKRYGDVAALSALSLTVPEGELFGLLGPNGAGKTTTIRICTGQLVPDDGEVTVLGTDPTSNGVETRRRVGVLPERESPPSFLTPREYFAFVGTVREMDEETVRGRVATWADRLAFRERLDTLVTDLSRGQQQKVMIAGAFLHEPSLVFIDEPLANLDPIMQERVKEFLTGYVERGNTVFLSTHYIETAEQLCTRVGIVDGGEVIAERDPSTLADGESLLDLFVANVDADADADAGDAVRKRRREV
ncbi:MAG: ABC transporter ATP-binding protein [Haloarculaceae archaeon]